MVLRQGVPARVYVYDSFLLLMCGVVFCFFALLSCVSGQIVLFLHRGSDMSVWRVASHECFTSCIKNERRF